MKIFPLMLLATILPATLFRPCVAADNVNLKVTGKVVAGACTVRPNDVIKNIDLGNNLAAKSAVGSMSATQRFTIVLINCPPGLTTATATFSGKPAAIQPDYIYENTATDSPAKNVGIVLQKMNGIAGLGNGQTYSLAVKSGTSATYTLETYAYSLGNATPGNISASVVMTLAYN